MLPDGSIKVYRPATIDEQDRKEKHAAIVQAIKDLELRPPILDDHIMSIIAWSALNAMEETKKAPPE